MFEAFVFKAVESVLNAAVKAGFKAGTKAVEAAIQAAQLSADARGDGTGRPSTPEGYYYTAASPTPESELVISEDGDGKAHIIAPLSKAEYLRYHTVPTRTRYFGASEAESEAEKDKSYKEYLEGFKDPQIHTRGVDALDKQMGLSDAKPTLVVPALDTAAAQSATTRIAHRTHVSAASVSGTPDALDELRVAGPSLLPSPPATRQTRQQWAQSFHTSAKSDLPTIPSSRQTVLRGAASVSGTCDALGQHLVEKSMHPVKSAPAMMGSSSSAASTPSNDPRPVIFSPTPVTDRPSLRGFGSSPISHAASSLVSPQPSSRYSRRTTEGSAASPAVSSTPFRSARALLALGSMVPPL